MQLHAPIFFPQYHKPFDLTFNSHSANDLDLFQAFAAVLSLLPLALAVPTQHYGHPAPAYGGYPEPAYQPQPYGYQPQPQPYGGYHPQPQYGYEQPKHNCSVEDAKEIAEVCTPSLKQTCEQVEIAVKKISVGEYCYENTRTVCSENIVEIPNEVCTYNYQKKYEDTTGRTVEVTFKKETNVQMVTVCQPGYGHGYHSYGHQYCKEVAQETAYNVPVVEQIDVDVKVAYPEPVKTCVNKPISLPQISCESVTEQKCVQQPQVEDAVETLEKCTTGLGEPNCQKVELTLPKQKCVEIVYGYAHDAPKHEKPAPPTYQEPAKEPAPTYPPPTYPAQN